MKNSGSSAALRQLQKTQRIATLAITGTLRSSPNDFMDAHTGLLPIDLALRKATYRAVIRLLTLPYTHPLHGIVQYTKEHPPSRHQTPIASLLRIFKLSGTTIETITPTIQLPGVANYFTIKIQESREKSIVFKKNDRANFRVYSDGSGLNEGIGVAIVLYTKDRHTLISHLKKYIGPNTKHNMYKAEIIGAILGMWLLSNCPETVGKKVSLYIDNQAVILGAKNPKTTPRQYLMHQLILSANTLGCNLDIHWISSHSKVKGNEKVDDLTKEAANSRSSARARMPHLLRSPLPVSASAIKQEYHEELKTKWEKIWVNSTRSRRMELHVQLLPMLSDGQG
jgi:ribonuclease HI